MGKSNAIYLRVSDEDKQKILENMEKVGVRNMSAYMLKMSMQGYMIQVDMTDVKEMLRLLRINSNNLNQIARHANETGSILKNDIEKLQEQQHEILQLMGEFLEKVSKLK